MTLGMWVTVLVVLGVGGLFGHSLTALWYDRRNPECRLRPIVVRVAQRPSRIDWNCLEAARDPRALAVGARVVDRESYRA